MVMIGHDVMEERLSDEKSDRKDRLQVTQEMNSCLKQTRRWWQRTFSPKNNSTKEQKNSNDSQDDKKLDIQFSCLWQWNENASRDKTRKQIPLDLQGNSRTLFILMNSLLGWVFLRCFASRREGLLDRMCEQSINQLQKRDEETWQPNSLVCTFEQKCVQSTSFCPSFLLTEGNLKKRSQLTRRCSWYSGSHFRPKHHWQESSLFNQVICEHFILTWLKRGVDN